MPTPEEILKENGFDPTKLADTVERIDKESQKADDQTRQETICDLSEMKAEMLHGLKSQSLWDSSGRLMETREDGVYLYVDNAPVRVRSLINQLEKLECCIKEQFGE